ncbi:MAG: hypothetical protein WC812_03180 [Candidatus Pacearchaeota archaeon]|jgi:hypothetical protein
MLRLHELIEDETLNPIYEIVNSEEFLEKQENPIIEFYGFENISPKYIKTKIKEIAFNLNDIKLSDDKYLYNWKLKQEIEETKQELNNSKFWNYHAFWKRSGWKKDRGSAWDACSLILAGLTFAPGGEIICPLLAGFAETFNEWSRRRTKKIKTKKLNSLEEIQDKYNAFMENVENAKVKEYIPSDATKFIKKINEELKDNSNYFNLNIESVNEKLKQIYNP